ncbi:DUF5134 domain-containing protein [Nocardia noduli]|uniref:DUF5134 domain-containing protein n=1 Tax=Nocardia noduli TaxID=2815722 RepID=UPI001C227E5A|nr:DUF5134 domain-containing protein [Nocardia noduli]
MDHANTAVTWALFVACLLAAIVAGTRLFRPDPGRFGRGGELVHVIMLVAMSAMWTTAGAGLPIAFWRIVFGAVAVGSTVWSVVGGRRIGPASKEGRFGAVVPGESTGVDRSVGRADIAPSSRPDATRSGEPAVADRRAEASGRSVGGGNDAELFGEKSGAAIYHGIAAFAMVYATLTPHGPRAEHTPHASTPPIPAIGWVLVALFVLDAMVLVATALRVPERFGRSLPATFAAVFPHATMDFAMATMLALALRPPG